MKITSDIFNQRPLIQTLFELKVSLKYKYNAIEINFLRIKDHSHL